MRHKHQRLAVMDRPVTTPAHIAGQKVEKSSDPVVRVAIPAPPEPGKLRWSLAPL